MIDLKIANRIEDIQKIAIFAQLKNDQLLTILKNAKIINLKKDQILFSQMETNLRILLHLHQDY